MLDSNHLISQSEIPEGEQGWIARINHVNGDQLVVTITEDDGEEHHAIWDRQETEQKLSNKEYYLVGKTT